MSPRSGVSAAVVSSPEAASSRGRGGAGLVVFLTLLCLVQIIAYFDRVNLSVALTVAEFKSFFQLTDVDRGRLNGAFFWTYALLQIPAGWLVDRYGAKKTLAIGCLLWSTVAAGTGLAQSFGQLFLLRLLLGVGEAVMTPAGMRAIRLRFDEKQRGTAIGIFMAAAKVGPALGNFLAGYLILTLGWRPMFLVLGAIGFVWIVPWLLLARKDPGSRSTPSTEAAPPPTMSMAVVFRSPALWGILIATFAYQYFNYFCMTWMQAYLVEARQLSLQTMSVFTGFSYGGFAVVAILAGWWADRLVKAGREPFATRKLFAISGLALASTQIIGAYAPSGAVALTFALISLCGLGLMTANYWALTQTLFPNAGVGRLVGIQNCAANLAGVAASEMTGYLKQTSGGFETPMLAVSLILAAGIASYALLVRRRFAPPVA